MSPCVNQTGGRRGSASGEPEKTAECCIANNSKIGNSSSRKRCTYRSLSLIRGRLVQEIRPLGKALCLACLRLPVIIIKDVSPTATAEQSSHLERRPIRMKTRK